MADFGSYYTEVPDHDRFRTAVEEDKSNLRLFSNVFSK